MFGQRLRAGGRTYARGGFSRLVEWPCVYREKCGGGVMSTLIGVLAVGAELMIVLVMWTAIASYRRSLVARPLIAFLAFVCAWLLTAVVDALRVPAWATCTGVMAILVSLTTTGITLHVWTQAGYGGQRDPGERDDHGGGGLPRGRPDGPQPSGRDSDPVWWPGFERDLALYAAERAPEQRRATRISD